jgi:hypothetical protein
MAMTNDNDNDEAISVFVSIYLRGGFTFTGYSDVLSVLYLCVSGC